MKAIIALMCVTTWPASELFDLSMIHIGGRQYECLPLDVIFSLDIKSFLRMGDIDAECRSADDPVVLAGDVVVFISLL